MDDQTKLEIIVEVFKELAKTIEDYNKKQFSQDTFDLLKKSAKDFVKQYRINLLFSRDTAHQHRINTLKELLNNQDIKYLQNIRPGMMIETYDINDLIDNIFKKISSYGKNNPKDQSTSVMQWQENVKKNSSIKGYLQSLDENNSTLALRAKQLKHKTDRTDAKSADRTDAKSAVPHFYLDSNAPPLLSEIIDAGSKNREPRVDANQLKKQRLAIIKFFENGLGENFLFNEQAKDFALTLLKDAIAKRSDTVEIGQKEYDKTIVDHIIGEIESGTLHKLMLQKKTTKFITFLENGLGKNFMDFEATRKQALNFLTNNKEFPDVIIDEVRKKIQNKTIQTLTKDSKGQSQPSQRLDQRNQDLKGQSQPSIFQDNISKIIDKTRLEVPEDVSKKNRIYGILQAKLAFEDVEMIQIIHNVVSHLGISKGKSTSQSIINDPTKSKKTSNNELRQALEKNTQFIKYSKAIAPDDKKYLEDIFISKITNFITNKVGDKQKKKFIKSLTKFLVGIKYDQYTDHAVEHFKSSIEKLAETFCFTEPEKKQISQIIRKPKKWFSLFSKPKKKTINFPRVTDFDNPVAQLYFITLKPSTIAQYCKANMSNKTKTVESTNVQRPTTPLTSVKNLNDASLRDKKGTVQRTV